MKMQFLQCAILSVGVATSIASAKTINLKVNLDPLIQIDKMSTITPDNLGESLGLDAQMAKFSFSWLDEDKSRAIFKRVKFTNAQIDMSLLDSKVPIDEAILDFSDGKLEGVTFSIFNRGDSGSIAPSEFEKRKSLLSDYLTKQLEKKPKVRSGNLKRGVMTTGNKWDTKLGKAVIVHNVEAPKQTEFLRMRVAPKSTEGIYEAALEDRSYATVRKSKLSKNVVEDKDNVHIANIPMVDQGAKGYCVVASAQRLFEYYGIACDMHQLAQLAKSDPEKGTSSLIINQELGAIDYLFQTRFTCLAIKHENKFHELKDDKFVGDEVSKHSLHKTIQSHIDKGIPLLWSLELGVKPETPNLNPQTAGGHMRIITGYNKKDNKIIFSDSWGKGHHFKTMDADDFNVVTKGLFSLTPTTN